MGVLLVFGEFTAVVEALEHGEGRLLEKGLGSEGDFTKDNTGEESKERF